MRSLLILLVPCLVHSQCITKDDKKPSDDPSARIALVEGQQQFSIEMLRALNEEYTGANIFFSPHSVYQSVLLAYIAAANHTETDIQKALFLPSEQSKLSTVQSYTLEKHLQKIRQTNESTDYQYTTCNKIFAAIELPLRDCIKGLLKDEIEATDFKGDPKGAWKQINDWVEAETRKNIKDLLPQDAVHEETKVILGNAAYFKGLWKSRFLLENTKSNALFYVNASTIRYVPMMKQKGTFNTMLSESLKAHVLELPYKGDSISMVILLPRFEDDAVDKLIQRLSKENLKESLGLDGLFSRTVEVQLPRFTVEQTMDLKPVLTKLGLAEMFNDTSDFSTLTGQNDVHFTDAIHKAKVKVDEEGTVAAAATAVFTFRSSRPLDPSRFIANHPFVYLIFDKIGQNVLFMGVYRVPAEKAKYQANSV